MAMIRWIFEIIKVGFRFFYFPYNLMLEFSDVFVLKYDDTLLIL